AMTARATAPCGPSTTKAASSFTDCACPASGVSAQARANARATRRQAGRSDRAGMCPGCDAPSARRRRARTRLRRMLRCAREGGELARIELDHEVRLHLHGVGHVGKLRDAGELRRHFRMVDLDIVRHVALGQRDRLEYDRELLRLLLDLDQIADFDAIA